MEEFLYRKSSFAIMLKNGGVRTEKLANYRHTPTAIRNNFVFISFPNKTV